jgi:D-arabinose 1-dehydrogenase-like Zn-dependent alcohol dehydrogenase
MLDFCAAHGVTADVEMIAMDEIDASERLLPYSAARAA